MSERLKGMPVWHKVFGIVETLALAACATGERIGFVTPTPEGTKTTPAETIAPPVNIEGVQSNFSHSEIGLDPSNETVDASTQENRWGTYRIENANIGIIEEVSIVDGNQVLDSGFNQILLDEGKREINYIFQDANAYKNYKVNVQVIQMEGSQGTAEWPIIIVRNLKTGKIYRWAVWALTPGGYSLKIPSEKDLRDNAQLLVPLAEVSALGSPGGGSGTGPDVIGPVVGDGVQPTFRLIQNSGWYFIPPFPDLSDQVISIKSGGF